MQKAFYLNYVPLMWVTRKTGNYLLTGKRMKLTENVGKCRKTPKLYQNLGRRKWRGVTWMYKWAIWKL